MVSPLLFRNDIKSFYHRTILHANESKKDRPWTVFFDYAVSLSPLRPRKSSEMHQIAASATSV